MVENDIGQAVDVRLQSDVPDFLKKDVESKLVYVAEGISGVKLLEDGAAVRLTFADAAPTDDLLHAVEDKVNRAVSALVKGAFEPVKKVVIDRLDRPIPYSENPMDTLLENGAVSQEEVGLFTLGPLLSNLIARFEELFEDLAIDRKAELYRFPALIPAQFMEKVNYLKNFPHALGFVSHLSEDFDNIDNFGKTATCACGHLEAPDAVFAPVRALLPPTLCHHLYLHLAGRTLENDQVAATASGNCFRYESSNLVSLERLWNFTMREIIFVGSADFVQENILALREKVIGLFEEIGFAFSIESANDPFFITSFRDQAAYQSAFDLKHEVRAALPFKNDTLAVASSNLHKDFFGRTLDIKLSDGSLAHSGCVGFGLERMAFALVSQYGPDPAEWPQAVRPS